MSEWQEMAFSKQKNSLRPILSFCVLRTVMQKIRTRRCNLCFSHSDRGEEEKEDSKPACPPKCLSARRYPPNRQRFFWGVCVHTPNRQEGTRFGRIISSVTFSFNLGFQSLLEKPITSEMQKYRIEGRRRKSFV